MANKKNEKKKNWFDTLCSLGSDAPSGKNDKNRTSAAKRKKSTGDRARVENRSTDPYDGFNDADIPPFDDTEETPVAESLFGDGGAPAGEIEGDAAPRTRSSRSRSTTASGSTSGRSSGRGTAPRSSQSTKGTSARSRGKAAAAEEPRKPAELVYFLQPYIIFVLGALLAVEMLLSCIMSGGQFDWTRETHPFRLIGYYLEYFFFGMLGYGAYLLPAAMCYLSLNKIRHKKLYRPTGKAVLAAAIVLLLPAVIHVCQVNAGVENVPDTTSISALYTAAGSLRAGAGVLGGLIAYAANVGLGVIGTVIIGVLLIVLLTLLLVGLTPAAAWQMLRTYARDRADRRAEYCEREEQKRLAYEEQRLLEAPAEEKKTRKSAAHEEEALPTLVDPKEARRAAREQEKRQAEALREAERSDRLEQGGKGRKKPQPPVDEPETTDEDDFDPTEALLDRERGVVPELIRKDTPTVTEKETKEEQEAEAVFGVIRELPPVEDDTPTVVPRADELPEADESAAQDEDGEPQVYPAHREIELDLDEPVPEEDADDDVTGIFRRGFLPDDEPAAEIPSAEDEDDGTVETIEGEGGVTIAVEKLSEEERMRGEQMVQDKKEPEIPKRPYQFPRVDMLDAAPEVSALAEAALQRKAVRLRDTLSSFDVKVEAVSYVGGPTVTRYEVKPAPGVRVRKIAALADDIAMGLEASGAIRIEAPIPGKNAVGIEVPNEDRSTVYLRSLIDNDTFRSSKSRLTCSLGEGVGGISVYMDITKMPHLLIAGSTGTGKSVCINSIIMSLLYKAKPDEVKLIMIDPKTVEFSVYKDIPHLMAPILCDSKRAAGALNLAVQEMERRYELMRQIGVRKIEDYNAATVKDRYERPYIPHIVIIIDELADLMMTAKNEVEASIVRLAQKARAAGIHLILGTQRPSVDVITGLIKANVPSRIAFTVTSQIDSRTILDNAGAEKLVGRGDMLYAPIGSSKPLRVQGCFVSDGEVERIVDFIRRNNDPVVYDKDFLASLDREAELIGNKKGGERDEDEGEHAPGDLDSKFYEALGVAVKNKRISTSLLQRAISVGYGRAAKILDQMEEKGFISEASGNKPREVLISEEAYRELMLNQDE